MSTHRNRELASLPDILWSLIESDVRRRRCADYSSESESDSERDSERESEDKRDVEDIDKHSESKTEDVESIRKRKIVPEEQHPVAKRQKMLTTPYYGGQYLSLPRTGNGSGTSCHQCKSRRDMANLTPCCSMLKLNYTQGKKVCVKSCV
jgi:hypothetical protein